MVVILVCSAFVLVMNYHIIFNLYCKVASNNILAMIITISIYFTLLRKIMLFYENFFHELTHMIFSIFFLENVNHFFASKTHGEVVTESPNMNIITASAPYYTPLLTLLLIMLSPVNTSGYYKLLVLITYGIYLAVVAKQIVMNHHEFLSLRWYGIIYSIVMTFWGSLFIFSWSEGETQCFLNLFKI